MSNTTGARTGDQFMADLNDGREVWLDGQKITDVTDHPALAGSVRGMAGYFDYQHAHADEWLVPLPETGAPMNISHIGPKSADDLAIRHRGFESLAKYSMGMLGRTPDYVNCTFAGFTGRPDIISMNGNEECYENLVQYHRLISTNDLSLTHTIVQPVVDKSVGDVEGINGDLALHKVGETADGIVVRGAKILATLGPFSDELTVYPGQPLPADTPPEYALSFAIPMNTPGLKTLCRDHYGVDGPIADRPFSSRFDEQDAFLIFDDVEIPRNRIFLDGNLEAYNRLMTHGWVGNIMQQTSIRARVKLEFAYELCVRMVETVNGMRPDVEQMLGEIWTYAALTRSVTRAAEADAREFGSGTWFCDEKPFHALRPTMPGWMVRTNSIVKDLGSHNLLATPTRADLDHDEFGPLISEFITGAGAITAEERAEIFRTAWDFAGSALGSRTELYERFYLASASRMYGVNHMIAQREREWNLVPTFLA